MPTEATTPEPGGGGPPPVDLRRIAVRSVMSSTVVAVRSVCHLSVAVDTFLRTGLRHLVVVDAEGRSGGIVSYDGVAAAWLDPDSRRASQVYELVTDPDTTADPDASVQQVARLMVNARLDAVPVVERDGRLVGIVTRSDLVRLLAGPS